MCCHAPLRLELAEELGLFVEVSDECWPLGNGSPALTIFSFSFSDNFAFILIIDSNPITMIAFILTSSFLCQGFQSCRSFLSDLR